MGGFGTLLLLLDLKNPELPLLPLVVAPPAALTPPALLRKYCFGSGGVCACRCKPTGRVLAAAVPSFVAAAFMAHGACMVDSSSLSLL